MRIAAVLLPALFFATTLAAQPGGGPPPPPPGGGGQPPPNQAPMSNGDRDERDGPREREQRRADAASVSLEPASLPNMPDMAAEAVTASGNYDLWMEASVAASPPARPAPPPTASGPRQSSASSAK